MFLVGAFVKKPARLRWFLFCFHCVKLPTVKNVGSKYFQGAIVFRAKMPGLQSSNVKQDNKFWYPLTWTKKFSAKTYKDTFWSFDNFFEKKINIFFAKKLDYTNFLSEKPQFFTNNVPMDIWIFTDGADLGRSGLLKSSRTANHTILTYCSILIPI